MIVYSTDREGRVLSGDFKSFRKAVFSGADVRVALGAKSFEERLAFFNSIILENEVIVSQPFNASSATLTRYYDPGKKVRKPYQCVHLYSTERRNYVLRSEFSGRKLRSNGPFEDAYAYYRWFADDFGWVRVCGQGMNPPHLGESILIGGYRGKFGFEWRGATFLLTTQIVYTRDRQAPSVKTLPFFVPTGVDRISTRSCVEFSRMECIISLSGRVSLWEADRFSVETPRPSRSFAERASRLAGRFDALRRAMSFRGSQIEFDAPIQGFLCINPSSTNIQRPSQEKQ